MRSGGHSWAAWSLRDDALLIDLGAARPRVRRGDRRRVGAPGGPGRRWSWLRSWPTRPGVPGGHCASVGCGGYLLQGGQGWDVAAGLGLRERRAADVVTADGAWSARTTRQNSDLLWAARGAGPGFPGVITRFHLQTYPAPRAMWQDTWTIRLDDAVRLLAWLHDVLPGLDRRVEPVVAATRLPDVPLHDGAARPDGTVLLLHTTVMADSDAEALALLAPLQDGPLAGRELGHVRGRTSVPEENLAQTAQNPEGHRYAVDCTWTDAPAAVLAPMLQALWGELDTEHSFSIWYGWAPSRTRPDMAFSVEANVYLATYAIYTDPADDERYPDWVHRRTAELAAAWARRLSRRHRLHPAAGPLHVRRREPPRLAEIRATVTQPAGSRRT